MMKPSLWLAVTKGDENDSQTHPHPRIKYGAGSNPPLEGEGKY